MPKKLKSLFIKEPPTPASFVPLSPISEDCPFEDLPPISPTSSTSYGVTDDYDDFPYNVVEVDTEALGSIESINELYSRLGMENNPIYVVEGLAEPLPADMSKLQKQPIITSLMKNIGHEISTVKENATKCINALSSARESLSEARTIEVGSLNRQITALEGQIEQLRAEIRLAEELKMRQARLIEEEISRISILDGYLLDY